MDQKEERNIQPEQNEETSIQKKKKNEERLRNLPDNFKHFNIWIIGVPEGEQQQQEIENLFEQIMKENFPSLAKKIDFQEVQEAQSSKEIGPKNTHQGTSSLSYPRSKTKRSSSEQLLPTKEFP